MADAPPPRPLPFAIPRGVDALKARDAKFWRAQAAWRCADDALAQDCSAVDKRRALLARVHQLRAAMLATPVRTGSALAVKLDALAAMGPGAFDAPLAGGFTVGDVIRWDAERISKGEIWGRDAFADTAQG